MKMSKKIKAIIAGVLVSVIPAPVLAATITIVPECARVAESGSVPQLSCVMELFGNVATMILGVTGSFALLMFVYGGFMMVISAGESSKIAKGKTILINAVIGIVIIMTAGIVLRYALNILVRNNNFKLIGQKGNCPTGQVYVQKSDGSIDCAAPQAEGEEEPATMEFTEEEVFGN